MTGYTQLSLWKAFFSKYVFDQNRGEQLLRTSCLYFFSEKNNKRKPTEIKLNESIPSNTRVELRIAGWNPDSVSILKQIILKNKSFISQSLGKCPRIYKKFLQKAILQNSKSTTFFVEAICMDHQNPLE